MIYKIQSNKDYNILESIEKIKKDYDLIYYNKILYLGEKVFSQDSSVALKKVKKYFRPIKDFWISEIGENNLKNEPKIIVDWCINKFIELDLQKFEIDKQKEMEKYLKSLDVFAEKLKEEAKKKEKEGGEV